MNFGDVIRRRKSTRIFSKRRVNWRVLLNAVDDALQGPYAANQMHMKFLFVEDPTLIKKVALHADQGWVADAPSLIVVCSDEAGLEALYGERGRIYGRQQAGAAIQTILLSCSAQSVDTCWIGAYDDAALRTTFGIPENIHIEAVIAVGSGTKEAGSAKKEKRSLESAIFWEAWGGHRRPSLFEEHVKSEDYRPNSS